MHLKRGKARDTKSEGRERKEEAQDLGNGKCAQKLD
jgi:hypothetical protein